MQNILKTVFVVVYVLHHVQDCSAASLITRLQPSIKAPGEQNRNKYVLSVILNKINSLKINQGMDDSTADRIVSAAPKLTHFLQSHSLLEKGKADNTRNEDVTGGKELSKVEKSKEASRYDDTVEKTGVDIPKKQVKRSTKSDKSTENENAEGQKKQMAEKKPEGTFSKGRKLFADQPVAQMGKSLHMETISSSPSNTTPLSKARKKKPSSSENLESFELDIPIEEVQEDGKKLIRNVSIERVLKMNRI